MADEDLNVDDILNDDLEEIEVDVGEEEAATTPEQSIEELKAQLEEEKQARERERERAEKAETRALSETQESQLREISLREAKAETDEAAMQERIKELRRQKKEARESGDVDAEDEIDEQLADARYNARMLGNYKTQLEKHKEQIKTQPKPRDPNEAWTMEDLKEKGYTPKAQAWIEKNPQYLTDVEFRRKATSAHYLAELEGIKVDTPEYFAFIEDKVAGKKGESNTSKTEDEPKTKASVVTRPSAPPTRNATPNNNNGRIVKLSPAQKEAADDSGMSYVEYAKYLEELKKEGKIN